MDWLAALHADSLVTIYIAAFHINSLLTIHPRCTTAFQVDFLVIIHARYTTTFHVGFPVIIHAGCIITFHVDFPVIIHARCIIAFQVGFPVTIHARCIIAFQVDFPVIIHAGYTTTFQVDFPVTIHARCIITFRVDFLVTIHARRITVFPFIDSAPSYCRRSCFCRCFHRTFLTASPSLTAGSGTLLGKFALISHHLVQIQTSEIPVLCNEKQIEVLNKMLQIFHGSSPLIGQQIQFVKIMFVFLLFSQKQYRFKIQPQPHAFHIGIQLHHFVIRHQAAIQPDKLLCIIHFFCVLV